MDFSEQNQYRRVENVCNEDDDVEGSESPVSYNPAGNDGPKGIG